jgi:hypothetical protein
MNRRKLQKGSALSIMLILAMGVGSVVTSFLGRTLVEQSRVSQRAAHMRAYRQAQGQLELAKAIVNASGYVGGQNLAVSAAMGSNPPCIPGTGVYVESAGPARWYRFTSCGEFSNQSAAVTVFMRDGLPYTGYNYYVEEHNLGISGRPKGKLHTNETLEFYFPNGTYSGFVSAVDGFTYKSGADKNNTTLQGGADPTADVKDLLDMVDFASLKASAAVVTPALQEAVITLQKKNVKVDMWSKPQVVQVAVTKFKKVQTGQVWQQVAQTVYQKQQQWVDVQKTQKVWVVVDPKSSGTDVAGGGSAGGYWKTVTYTVKELKTVNVAVGTKMVWQWVAVYTNVPYVELVNQTIPGALQSTKTYAVNGQVIFVQDNVKSISGDLNGKLSIVTDHDATINGSIRYIDGGNNYAYLNGLDSSKSYDPNPKFQRNHSFGLIAKGDVKYAKTAPQQIEINGSLVSTAGFVGMDGIVLDSKGNPSLSGDPAIKTSLRRFGSIMASKRPVATLLDVANQVVTGFTLGSSAYDEGLVAELPPGFPSEEISMWQPTMKEEGAEFTDGGSGCFDSNLVTPVMNLTAVATVRGKVKSLNWDWGKCQ